MRTITLLQKIPTPHAIIIQFLITITYHIQIKNYPYYLTISAPSIILPPYSHVFLTLLYQQYFVYLKQDLLPTILKKFQITMDSTLFAAVERQQGGSPSSSEATIQQRRLIVYPTLMQLSKFVLLN